MRRLVAACSSLACLLGLAGSAPGASAAWQPLAYAGWHNAASYRVVATGSVTGTVNSLRGSSLNIRTAGPRTGIVDQLTAAANRVTRENTPYVYGGGHAYAGRPSIGLPGPGYNGHRRGFDCSGSVAAVLAGGGLWAPGSGVPGDAGIISQLRSQGLIARGVGRGPLEVTLYDEPGVHIFMNIDGRFFGTSDGGGGGDARGGAGWLNDGAPDASSPRYRRFHVRWPLLRSGAHSGHSVTLQLQVIPDRSLSPGQTVRVHYEELGTGTLVGTAVR